MVDLSRATTFGNNKMREDAKLVVHLREDAKLVVHLREDAKLVVHLREDAKNWSLLPDHHIKF